MVWVVAYHDCDFVSFVNYGIGEGVSQELTIKRWL